MARSRKSLTRRSAVSQSLPDRYPTRVLPPTYLPPRRLVARLEDRRLFFPDVLPTRAAARTPAAWTRAAVQPVLRPTSPSRPYRAPNPWRVSFKIPKQVALCAKRSIRRNVLFAMKRTGKGSRSPTRRRNFWSNTGC